MASGLYLDRLTVLDATPCTVVSPYTPTSLQHNTASNWEVGSATAPFATAGTIEPCADYLETVLQDLGVKQWQLGGGDPAAVLNSLYELVQRLQDMIQSREKMQEEMQKLKVDVKTADRTIQRLQGQSDQKTQEAGGLNIKLRQLDSWYRDETDRWNAEREQMGKKCAQLEQRHTQFQHELRRKDAEFEKIQKQLANYLSGSKRGAGSSSSTAAAGRLTTRSRSGTVTSSGRAASAAPPDTRHVSKAELEEVHRRVVEAYEADKQEMLQECTALRKVLQSLEREHKELLNRVDQGPPAEGMHSSQKPDTSSADVQPVVTDPTGTLQQMQAKLEAMKIRKQRITGTGIGMDLQELQQHANTPSERLLMAKLLEAGKIMEEQETTLVMALKALPHARVRT